MSKVIKIRIYRVQDSDLYTIYHDRSFHFCEMAKQAFCAYANGRALPIFSLKGIEPLPKPIYTTNGVRGSGLRFSFVTSIAVPDSDRKAVALANYLLERKSANAFIKTILRRCLVDIEGLYFEGDAAERFPDPWPISVAFNKTVKSANTAEEKREKENRQKKPTKKVHVEHDTYTTAPSSPARNDISAVAPAPAAENSEPKTDDGPNLFSFAKNYEF